MGLYYSPNILGWLKEMIKGDNEGDFNLINSLANKIIFHPAEPNLTQSLPSTAITTKWYTMIFAKQ